MRALLGISDDQLRLVLDRRRFIWWIYLGRMILACAILVAAVFNWFVVGTETNKLVATLAFAMATMFTGWSVWHITIRSRPLSDTFLYVQLLFDVALVTAVVHVTAFVNANGDLELSQFAPLYIVVNTSAALLLPIGSSLLLALLGSALYAADVFWLNDLTISIEPLTQLSVFIIAAVATGWISSRLQQTAASSHQLAAALTQARLEAADILNNIRSGILTIDTKGALLYANPAASDLLGMNFESLEGRAVLPDIGRASPGLVTAIERAIHEKHTTRREEVLVRLSSRDFPIGVTTTSNDGDGDRVGRSVTAIFQDIADQKRLDQLRRRAERLEAVAELSASLAHEIRNPLASIRSAVEQLDRSPRTTPDEQTLSRLIVRESDRLTRLLAEFLDFARPNTAHLHPVDLAAIARGAAKLAASHPSCAEGVDVQCVMPDGPVIIEGDDDLLHRAVFNLVLNAVQAAPPAGHVRVEVAPATPDQLPAGAHFDADAVAIRVTDDGPGIDAAIRDRLFQPFATTKSGGSGLGLAVAHRAVEAHRGLVLFDSSDQGTRFTVLLPRAQTAASTSTGAAA